MTQERLPLLSTTAIGMGTTFKDALQTMSLCALGNNAFWGK